jgi:nucleotide-binding universal stress UspA family protein
MTLNRILCPVDFSDPSRRALRHALAIARWYESELTVLHVDDVLLHAASLGATGDPELPDRQHRELVELVDDAGGSGQPVKVHVAVGDPVSDVLGYATRDGSDLIVVGTNGRTGLARAVLGSVTERLVRRSPIPVLTIPPSATPPDDDVMRFDPILCASDFSPACRRALDMAIVMGQEADARLILFHALQLPVVDPGLVPAWLPASTAIDYSAFRNDALGRLEAGLPADAAFRCRPEAIVANGRAAESILEIAGREKVRLIVMGIESRSAFDRFLFGSTTRRVMQAAACPVLSIRADRASRPWPAWPPATREERLVSAADAVKSGG